MAWLSTWVCRPTMRTLVVGIERTDPDRIDLLVARARAVASCHQGAGDEVSVHQPDPSEPPAAP